MKFAKKIFVLIIFFMSAFKTTDQTDEKPPIVDIRKYKLNQYMKEFFSLDEEQNPLIKALEEHSNNRANQKQIDEIFGKNYSIIKDQFEQSRIYACTIVIAEMKLYEEDMPYENPKLRIVFKDFYDIMEFDLDPDTLSLNKETYVIFKEIDEGPFNDILANLGEMYKKYLPLRKHIDLIKMIFLKKLHLLVKKKCPTCINEEIEGYPDSKQDMHAKISADHEKGHMGSGGIQTEENKFKSNLANYKVHSLFKMMNEKSHIIEFTLVFTVLKGLFYFLLF